MKRLVLAVLLSLVPQSPVFSADHPTSASGKDAPAPLIDGLGTLHHPVSTGNPEAQKYFDQGLRLTFAFNHPEAIRAYKRAAEIDPSLAMAYWGVALALGPNINWPMDAPSEKEAVAAIRKAQSLAGNATEPEKAYIEALAVRYTDPPQTDRKALDVAYKEAMGRVKDRYPDDLDAAVLYAEAMMDLRPWQFWSADGKPAEGTEEMVAVLESVMKRDPWHIGANHYYIHAVEASQNPERAFGAAERLKGVTPGAGHLVHMPSHIYIRIGDYDQAARINEDASEVDRAYIEKYQVGGIYPMMYYNHNMHFAAVGNAMAGRYAEAMKSAIRVTENTRPLVKDMPMIEMFTPTTILVQTMFQRWDDILALSDPGDGFPLTRAAWRFARGSALSARGKAADAQRELEALTAIRAALPADAYFGLNTATGVLEVPRLLLSGRVAAARGDTAAAVDLLTQAIAAEDLLNYNEPADWYLSGRPVLGALLLRNGRAAEAERVYREDLRRRPRDGRSLLGLAMALEAQGRTWDARNVRAEHEAAWRHAEVPLTLADL